MRDAGRQLTAAVSGAQYRILSPAGEEREDGGADVEVAGGALVLAPSAGAVLRIPFGQISSVTEPEPMTFVYRADGPGGLAAINRALDDAGFGVAAGVPAALAPALVGQVPHDAQWAGRIAALLAG